MDYWICVGECWIARGRIGDGVVPDSSQTSEIGGRRGVYAMPRYALEER